MEASDIFRRAWLGPAPSETPGTYAEYPYENPALDSKHSDLRWLPIIDPRIADEMKPHWQEREELYPFEKFKANLEALKRQASNLGLHFPSTFLELMGSLELQYRIPSYTACYFDLSDQFIKSPFQTGDWIARF